MRELNERGVKGPEEVESLPRVPGESMFPGLTDLELGPDREPPAVCSEPSEEDSLSDIAEL